MSSNLSKGLAAARSTGNSFNPVNNQEMGKDSFTTNFVNAPSQREGKVSIMTIQGSQMPITNGIGTDPFLNKMQAQIATPGANHSKIE